MGNNIVKLKTRRETLAKQSIVDGYFDFTAIAHLQNNIAPEVWSMLRSSHGEPLSNMSASSLTNFYKYLCVALRIDIKSLIEPDLFESQAKASKNVEDRWISMLKGFLCNFQDIPLFERTERVCWVAVKLNPKDFYYVPDALKKIELCLLAMEKEPTMLFFLPDHLLNKSLYKKAVSLDAQLIHQIPAQHLKRDIWLTALGKDGLLLRFCPVNIVTSEMANAAVRSNGAAIVFVPPHLLTGRLCEVAIGSCPHGACLDDIPSSFQTDKLRLLAVSRNPMMLGQIPPQEQTETIRLEAIKRDGRAIQFIPCAEQSRLICFHALLNTLDSHPWVSTLHLYQSILLLQQINPDPRFPETGTEAVRQLVKDKCSICELFAKAYLSQFQANEVVPQIQQSVRNAQALNRVYNTVELIKLFRKLKIKGVLFGQALNL
jgi:hypothetical protein